MIPASMVRNRREYFSHAAVSEDRHVVDGVRARDPATNEGGDFESRVGALVGRDTQPVICQGAKARGGGEFHDRDQARSRHQIRVIE